MVNRTIQVNETRINVLLNKNQNDYICLTDMTKNFEEGARLIEKWLNNKSTIDFLGVWEQLNNPDFKTPEFGGIRMEAGSNRFYMSVNKFIERTGAIGIFAKAGRYGGTYAHKDIAYHFGMWLSPEFNLLVVKEFQRLVEAENNPLLFQWDISRILSKTNYQLQPRPHSLAGLHHLDKELARIIGRSLYHRCLYYKDHSMDMVEEVEEQDTGQGDELGGCHHLRLGGRLLSEHLLLPELRHSNIIAGEVPASR